MKKVFYLYKSGELLRKDYSLVLQEKNGNIIYIPIEQINLIICFNDITLNKRVLGILNTYSISIFFFNYYGDYIGRFTPKKYSDGKIIVNQVNSYCSEQRIYIARRIVQTEIKNVLALLKYYDKKYHLLHHIIEDINKYLIKLEEVETIEKLFLLEAQVKKIYYSSFDLIIKNPNFIFKQRSFYPPLNEINALLSYGYAILYANVLSDIDRSPLLPQISYLHSLSKQSDSLQFDLADMMKPIFIDRLILRMINRQQFNKSHFEYKENGVCYLNKDGIKIFLNEYEILMEKSIKIGERYYSYRNIITREVYKLSNYIEGKSKYYKPYVMEW
ncbi:CRISPR-associated endonuclease Cas1 [Thomasclavelia cocleata]|uniref:CRISPR-associated endonuclease Cas1 n=1 Tax=Thomasclavelia cocleata TaxID=69824 RepID=A0A1I0F523_9FIRM|nr:CRISPR-associated endonuclease Cas1 [Thomasclavelia cocleata]MCR1960681.1 CRISPR-associated endonuclease Cas1 [Thomasclavelia cocleata]NDO41353.1 CRISPR-associated endonuclease Cas1 [Thomasclavelia cocleata]PJN81821.1 CRISPR-associated endonuclease Cas1 [Thomasclavelia cocleata]SET52330.1 CRISP-associated protein Cas1 [Thomasclavelia cocleata]